MRLVSLHRLFVQACLTLAYIHTYIDMYICTYLFRTCCNMYMHIVCIVYGVRDAHMPCMLTRPRIKDFSVPVVRR